MKYVVVNGDVVWDLGTLTRRRPGRVLRGPGYKGPPSATANPQNTPEKIRGLDNLFTQFMDKHAVPGCAVAITRHGKLVYARGFGFADVATREPVSPYSLFRIASISKPITAVAIMQLIEQKKLKLDDRVFDILTDDDPHLIGDAKFDERQKEITIRHLLEHRGGWDRDKSFDPMFQSTRFADALGKPAPAEVHDIIRNMLGLPLDFNPGERFAYSNYGYCLLGRVIEKLTNQPYDEYVKQHVLAPLQITTMQIGGSFVRDRKENEVRYYDPQVTSSVFAANRGRQVAAPYGAFKVETLDSHGGWIASAVDLVRFASAFDDPAKCPILSGDSIRTMFSPPPGKVGEVYYALGWSVRPVADKLTTWHTGSLPGTSTVLYRRYDGLNVAVLFNSRVSPTAQHLTRELEGPLFNALDNVRDWPDVDHFARSPK